MLTTTIDSPRENSKKEKDYYPEAKEVLEKEIFPYLVGEKPSTVSKELGPAFNRYTGKVEKKLIGDPDFPEDIVITDKDGMSYSPSSAYSRYQRVDFTLPTGDTLRVDYTRYNPIYFGDDKSARIETLKGIEITQEDVRQKKDYKSAFDYNGKPEEVLEELTISLKGFIFVFRKIEDVSSKKKKTFREIKRYNEPYNRCDTIRESTEYPSITPEMFDNLLSHINSTKEKSRKNNSNTGKY